MDFDAIVVGAGPAGCMVARELARRGWRLGLFEAAERERLGKAVVVELERSVFSAVGLAEPAAEDVPYHPQRTRVLSARRRLAFTVEQEPAVVALRLDRLAHRLLGEAEAAGVALYDGYRARRAIERNGRVAGVSFEHRRSDHEVRAKLVVDATGFAAALVRGLSPGLSMGFRDDAADVVLAENGLYAIDRDRAAQAVEDGRHGDEELWVAIGPFGTYSTEFSFLSLAQGRAYVLIGHKAELEGSSLGALMADHQQRLGYYRERMVGGQGRIRIARALDRLVIDGLMAVGEAACMVHPMLGSGVATALHAGALAARVASQALALDRPSSASLWPYAAAYQRGRGALLAGFDVVRRATEKRSADEVEAWLEGGWVTPEDMHAITAFRPPSPSPRALPRRAAALARHPRVAAQLARPAAVAALVYAHHRRYPSRCDPAAHARWSRRAAQLRALLP